MTTDTNDTPELTDEQSRKLAETFLELEDEYRNEPRHREVVYEDDDKIILADHTGHELTELAKYIDMDRDALSRLFHETARIDTDYSWSVSDPIVFPKFVDRREEYDTSE